MRMHVYIEFAADACLINSLTQVMNCVFYIMRVDDIGLSEAYICGCINRFASQTTSRSGFNQLWLMDSFHCGTPLLWTESFEERRQFDWSLMGLFYVQLPDVDGNFNTQV